jgi:hypothetical protein
MEWLTMVYNEYRAFLLLLKQVVDILSIAAWKCGDLAAHDLGKLKHVHIKSEPLVLHQNVHCGVHLQIEWYGSSEQPDALTGVAASVSQSHFMTTFAGPVLLLIHM